ncbi:hypothetical protein CIB93_09150 [Streptomyces sp. WZ.A104]|uniref:hypothetical protein n=1 Tax=Streptomyces sp. WZ.A104 TaxID=2023771 RepID=UPI000BBC95A6|nr:hypothetical protein [Streptomyces sp. WZ.A104]PCG86388.1 hypothetical protein CIB93_09150 [Streptomyces sp. WZ.A104]
MKTRTEPITLSDGATIRVRIERGPTGDTILHEDYARHHDASAIYWRGHQLYLVWEDQLHPIEHPQFKLATTLDEAAETALAFFAKCAEDTITHAREHGIPVEACYSQS